MSDFDGRNHVITEKRLHQVYDFHILLKICTKMFNTAIKIMHIDTIQHAEILSKSAIPIN